MNPTLTLYTLVALLPVAATMGATQVPPLNDYRADDPQFLERFLHHYLPNPATEPSISRSEQELFRSIVPQIESSPRRALDTLIAARSTDSSAAVDFLIGNLQLQQNNLPAAGAAYRQALEKFPSFLRAHRNLGLIEIQQGNPSQALEHLRMALELGGASGETYGLMGYAHLNLDNPASARIAYEQAILFQPHSRDWRTGLTQALLQTNAYDSAAAILEELIQSYPDDPMLWQFQANLMIARDRPTAALTALEIARRLAPLPADSLFLLGELFHRADVTDEAVAAWLSAIQTDPNATANRLPHVLALLASGQQWSEFSRLIEGTPTQVIDSLSAEQQDNITYLVASRDWQTGSIETAAEQFNLLVDRNPLHGPALLALAQIRRQQGDSDAALLLLERAARRPDSRLNALLLSARIHVDRSEFKAAIPILEQAIAIESRPDIIRYTDAVRQAHRNTGQ